LLLPHVRKQAQELLFAALPAQAHLRPRHAPRQPEQPVVGFGAHREMAQHGEQGQRRPPGEASLREHPGNAAAQRGLRACSVASIDLELRQNHAETARAINYMLTRWPAFTRFLDDGRICLTNNAAERALRGIALGRRAWLFAGSDRGGERAAAMYTLIATALCRARHSAVYAAR